MSMGYPEDDPRDQMYRENFAMKLYQELPGKTPARRALKGGPRSVTLPARAK